MRSRSSKLSLGVLFGLTIVLTGVWYGRSTAPQPARPALDAPADRDTKSVVRLANPVVISHRRSMPSEQDASNGVTSRLLVGVVAHPDMEPLAGASVGLASSEEEALSGMLSWRLTNSAGQASFELSPTLEDLWVLVHHEGFDSRLEQIPIEATSMMEARLVLDPLHSVTVRVLDRYENPIEDAEVRLCTPWGERAARMVRQGPTEEAQVSFANARDQLRKTDFAGRARFALSDTRLYLGRVLAEGYWLRGRTFTLDASAFERGQKDVTLEKIVVLGVVLVQPDGTPSCLEPESASISFFTNGTGLMPGHLRRDERRPLEDALEARLNVEDVLWTIVTEGPSDDGKYVDEEYPRRIPAELSLFGQAPVGVEVTARPWRDFERDDLTRLSVGQDTQWAELVVRFTDQGRTVAPPAEDWRVGVERSSGPRVRRHVPFEENADGSFRALLPHGEAFISCIRPDMSDWLPERRVVLRPGRVHVVEIDVEHLGQAKPAIIEAHDSSGRSILDWSLILQRQDTPRGTSTASYTLACDDAGSVTLPSLADGEYLIGAVAPGFLPNRLIVTVDDEHDRRFQVELEPVPVRHTGESTDPD